MYKFNRTHTTLAYFNTRFPTCIQPDWFAIYYTLSRNIYCSYFAVLLWFKCLLSQCCFFPPHFLTMFSSLANLHSSSSHITLSTLCTFWKVCPSLCLKNNDFEVCKVFQFQTIELNRIVGMHAMYSCYLGPICRRDKILLASEQYSQFHTSL